MLKFRNKQIQTVIFDMDGTMFDTERLRFDTIRQASTEIVGSPIKEETLIGSLGLSAVRAEALAKKQNGADYPYREIRARADELELSHVRTYGVPVKQGLREILERLRHNGLSLAVATSSRRAIAEEYLINANVLKYFDITVCGDEVDRGKPHPEIFLRAARNLAAPIEESLIVEDSENGLRAAIAAGGLPIYIKDIKDPTPDTRAKVFQGYESMIGFLDDLREATQIKGTPKLTEPFPATTNDSTVGIHGFGAMGGGYLAQVFSHWDGYTRPSEIIGVTGDAVLREMVNALGKYSVRYAEQAFDQTINNVRLIDHEDEDGICDMYTRSAIIGLSMPESAIRKQAPMIARGLLARHLAGGGDLVILTILNRISGAAFCQSCVKEALQELTKEHWEEIYAKTYFPETVVNRIVSRLSRESLLRQARIKLRIFSEKAAADQTEEPSAFLPEGLAEPTRELRRASALSRSLNELNLILYHSEPDMPVYASKGTPILERLRQISTTDDINQVQMIKNRLWNGTHAIIAWYAHLLGYDTIGQGMTDRRVTKLLDSLIDEEIRPAILRAYPETAELMPSFVKTFTTRCRSSFKDPCVRVGRDPLRKLQRRERVFGNIDMARKYGISTNALEFGAALGIVFALQSTSSTAKECQLIQELYHKRGKTEDVLTYNLYYNGRPYAGLDAERDADLIKRITAHTEALLNQPEEEDTSSVASPAMSSC